MLQASSEEKAKKIAEERDGGVEGQIDEERDEERGRGEGAMEREYLALKNWQTNPF